MICHLFWLEPCHAEEVHTVSVTAKGQWSLAFVPKHEPLKSLCSRTMLTGVMNRSPILPSRMTVLLFLLMVILWYQVQHDAWLDAMAEPYGDILLVAFIALIVGLCGVYGASIACSSPRLRSSRRFLLKVCVRTALLGGLASAVASFFS